MRASVQREPLDTSMALSKVSLVKTSFPQSLYPVKSWTCDGPKTGPAHLEPQVEASSVLDVMPTPTFSQPSRSPPNTSPPDAIVCTCLLPTSSTPDTNQPRPLLPTLKIRLPGTKLSTAMARSQSTSSIFNRAKDTALALPPGPSVSSPGDLKKCLTTSDLLSTALKRRKKE